MTNAHSGAPAIFKKWKANRTAHTPPIIEKETPTFKSKLPSISSAFFLKY